LGAETMIGALKRVYANFRGFDIDGSTVPPMDGPLRPNAALDAASVAIALPEVDNLIASSSSLKCSIGKELLTLDRRPRESSAAPELLIIDRQIFDHPISSLASESDAGLAVALDGSGIIIRGGRYDGVRIEGPAADRFSCVTAMAFKSPDLLLVCNGSRQHPAADWKRDLMSHGSTGSLWKVELSKPGTPATQLASDLGFPSGVEASSGSRVVFSEAWRHNIRTVDLISGTVETVQSGLPAYPGRVVRALDGGFWLALFAPRNPLVEFVLKENVYRRRMIETIDPAYWIAPSLFTGRSFLEPIQGGARKKLNMLKPWAPTWSAGLVVRCDSDMRPLTSFHSRADGNVHGVTSICQMDGVLFVAAKGSGVIVGIESGPA
jgi:hypothetical protein